MKTDLHTAYDALRHYLVSLVYRFNHVLENAPENFATFEAGEGVREPIRIVRHLTVVIRFSHDQFEEIGAGKLEPLSWEDEKMRFLEAVKAFDVALKNGVSMRETDLNMSLEQVWQGPLVDAMTHIGQLATLRRLAGSPIKSRRYWQLEMPPVE